ncbi:MAG: PfkB family carbohydrate kinase, partial [Patescibacteria group bacterium]|nr:PfkB family carbohydrate kinase [Patescibacteria group bacterium]
RGHETSLPRGLGRSDFLVIAPSSKQEIVHRCTEAHKHHIPYMFDPGQQITSLSSEELLYGAERAAVAIFNDYEWQLYREKTSHELDDLTSKGVVVIVTRGEQGSVIYTKESNHDIEIAAAKPREVLDPTGAGDAYRAGIVAGIAHQWEWRETGQFAATIASYAVEAYGTQEHAPTLGDINERYEKNFEGKSPLAEPKELPPNQDRITYE